MSNMSVKIANPSKAWLVTEFVMLYIGIPVVFQTVLLRGIPTAFLITFGLIPFVFTFGMIATLYLIRSPGFANSALWNVRAALAQLPRILLIFLFFGVALFTFVCMKCPQFLFYCPRSHHQVWLTTLWSYPLLGVYPQEIIYRGFLFHRYQSLFNQPRHLIIASAAVFSFGHILYLHPYSILLTLVGGYLFGYTYWKSQSLLAASFEHALYGSFLYTIGLGRFFFIGIEKLIG
jgi:membrane protease YdiL (CAAX protease family)